MAPIANIADNWQDGSMASAVQQTFFPDDSDTTADIIDFANHLRERGFDAPEARTRLVSQSGESVELPPELFEVLKLAAEMLVARDAVTIVATRKQLTTQEAADFLGISRPTLIKLVDAGRIPCTKVGRHRRIRLADLLAYQDDLAAERETALTEMVQIARDADLYEKTAQSGEGIR